MYPNYVRWQNWNVIFILRQCNWCIISVINLQSVHDLSINVIANATSTERLRLNMVVANHVDASCKKKKKPTKWDEFIMSFSIYKKQEKKMKYSWSFCCLEAID